MRAADLAALLSVVALALSGCMSSPAANPEAVETRESLLYVQTARQAVLVPVGPDRLSVQLTAVDPRVVYFTDRPERDAGGLSNDAMLESVFHPGLALPNAAFVGRTRETGEPVTLALELEQPRYDAAASTMTYLARILDASTAPAPGLDPFMDMPVLVAEPALFIDSDSYHRCWATLSNTTPYDLRLDRGAMSPPVDGGRWSGLPDEVSAGTSSTWAFRYHADTAVKIGQMRFVADDAAAHSLLVNHACQGDGAAFDSGGTFEAGRSSCSPQPFSPLHCEVSKDDRYHGRFEVTPR